MAKSATQKASCTSGSTFQSTASSCEDGTKFANLIDVTKLITSKDRRYVPKLLPHILMNCGNSVDTIDPHELIYSQEMEAAHEHTSVFSVAVPQKFTVCLASNLLSSFVSWPSYSETYYQLGS